MNVGARGAVADRSRARRTDRALVVLFPEGLELLAGREAVSQLFEAEARYRGLVEQVPWWCRPGQRSYDHLRQSADRGHPGGDPAGVQGRLRHVAPHGAPDDRDWVQGQSQAFLAGEGGDLDGYRMVRPDGRVVGSRDRAFAYRDDAGRVILEQGLLFDVTELKEAEARVTHMAYHDALTVSRTANSSTSRCCWPSSARAGIGPRSPCSTSTWTTSSIRTTRWAITRATSCSPGWRRACAFDARRRLVARQAATSSSSCSPTWTRPRPRA